VLLGALRALTVAVAGTAWPVLGRRIRAPPRRGDVKADSVVAVPTRSGRCDLVAVLSETVPGGWVALDWQVPTGGRGRDTAGLQMPPADAVLPAVCATPAAGILPRAGQGRPHRLEGGRQRRRGRRGQADRAGRPHHMCGRAPIGRPTAVSVGGGSATVLEAVGDLTRQAKA